VQDVEVRGVYDELTRSMVLAQEALGVVLPSSHIFETVQRNSAQMETQMETQSQTETLTEMDCVMSNATQPTPQDMQRQHSSDLSRANSITRQPPPITANVSAEPVDEAEPQTKRESLVEIVSRKLSWNSRREHDA